MKANRLAVFLLVAGLACAFGSGRTTTAQSPGYGISSVVVLPNASAAFDISWVDPASHRYYLGDRTNGTVDVIDTTNDRLVDQIGGFVGFRGKNSISGPNGVLVVPGTTLLFVGDGDSTLKVVDLATNSIVATIPTGAETRVDEMAYDAKDRVITVTNPEESPPFLTFVSVDSLKIVGKLTFPEATDGIEQPAWDPGTGLFYQAVPASMANKGGEIDAIDPATFTVTKVYPLADCTPHGTAVGPNGQLLAGCFEPGRSVIINLSDGSVAATITDVGGSDEVWYNPSDSHYYLAAYVLTSDGTTKGTPKPSLGIIDAATNTWLANVPTVAGAHSVAVDPSNGHVYVPLTNIGIGVYTPR